jgi:hypothetical protein
MKSICLSTSATGAPPPIILQSGAIRRRISASDSVAALVASLAFGESRRSDLGALAAVTANRCATAGEVQP